MGSSSSSIGGGRRWSRRWRVSWTRWRCTGTSVATAASRSWRRRRSVVVELGEGAREGSSGGVEWRRGALGLLQARLGGSGRAGGGRGVVDVLKQLGGIPPSSLGARGEVDDKGRRRAGPAGGPRPGRQVGFSYFFVCLIFPFLILFLYFV